MRIAVVDGQGGGIGTTIIKKIKETYGEEVEVWALGTNAIATAQMMNAIRWCSEQVEVIAGPISILVSQAMMGEVTPAMVQALGASSAVKLLLPLSQEAVVVIGALREPLPHMVEKLVCEHLKTLLSDKKGTP